MPSLALMLLNATESLRQTPMHRRELGVRQRGCCCRNRTRQSGSGEKFKKFDALRGARFMGGLTLQTFNPQQRIARRNTEVTAQVKMPEPSVYAGSGPIRGGRGVVTISA